jgi:N-glycosylase/DNA lyase
MDILQAIESLKRSGVSDTIAARLDEFREAGRSPDIRIFQELSFCLLTANFNAQRTIEIQKALGDGFLTLTEPELSKKLKQYGHRFPEARAKFIVEARQHAATLRKTLGSFSDERALRAWLADNVKGLGYKESSHFLRNIGYENIAIIDFHIIDLLVRHGLIQRPKTLTPKKYLEIEQVLKNLGRQAGLNMAELDLYLWYIETGKILK